MSLPLPKLSLAVFVMAAFSLAGPGFAQGKKGSGDEVEGDNPKLTVVGDRLIFDTENVPDGVEDSIESDDVDPFLAVLQGTEGIKILELNSTGGSNWAARRIADMVIDFGLDTIVNGECASSCVRIFLGGTNRSMTTGSRMGFHQFWWGPRDIENYYDRNSGAEGWDTPFEMGSWLYTDAQSELYEHLTFMVRRGVDAGFAIETFGVSPDEMWHPYRIRLRAANVLTE